MVAWRGHLTQRMGRGTLRQGAESHNLETRVIGNLRVTPPHSTWHWTVVQGERPLLVRAVVPEYTLESMLYTDERERLSLLTL